MNHRHWSKVRVIKNGKMQNFTEKKQQFFTIVSRDQFFYVIFGRLKARIEWRFLLFLGHLRYHFINTPVSSVLGLQNVFFLIQNFLQMTRFCIIFLNFQKMLFFRSITIKILIFRAP